MKNTLARIKFKNNFGSANQFFVTSMVALHHLNNSNIKSAPEVMHTTWSPHDRAGTISRSRTFVKQSFLAWAVDSIDMYVSLLNRSPKYLQETNERLIFEQAGRSVYKKSINLGKELQVSSVTLALLDVLITWRNNSLHSLAENTITSEHLGILEQEKDIIRSTYRGLDPSSLPEKAHSGLNLTFKETASLINVAHKYVEELDAIVITKLNKQLFCTEAISDKLYHNNEFARKYSSLQGKKRETMVKTWLQNNLSYPNAAKNIVEACSNVNLKQVRINKSLNIEAEKNATLTNNSKGCNN